MQKLFVLANTIHLHHEAESCGQVHDLTCSCNGSTAAAECMHVCDCHLPVVCRYSLHVLMVQHGKVCPSCSKQGPKQRSKTNNLQCPLSPLKGSKTSGQLNDENVSSLLASSRKKQKTVVAAAATGAAAVSDFDALPPDM
jgi:hypothetical protein